MLVEIVRGCRRFALLGVLLGTLLAVRRAHADERREPLDIREWEHLSGDWGGARADLREAGIEVELFLVYELSRPLSGGIRKHTSDRMLLDFNGTFDLERIVGLPGASVFAQGIALAGGNGSDDVGDIQTFSNIAVDDDFVYLAELWFEQTLFDGALRCKIGKVDANSEFAHIGAAGEFIHSSAGFSPTIFALPTFPDSAVSANAFVQPVDDVYAGVGLYNADDDGPVSGRRGLTAKFDGVLAVGEAGVMWGEPDGAAGAGRLGAGFWHHSGDFERFDGGEEDGTGGLYVVAEQNLWRADTGESGAAAANLFLQFGLADRDVSPFERHFGVGLELAGLLPGRGSDVSGIYWSYADLSDDPDAGFPLDEVAWEIFHLFRITRYLGVKPVLQYIANPSGSREIDDTIVGTLRVELVF